MHEGAGDVILRRGKARILKQAAPVPPILPPPIPRSPVRVRDKVNVNINQKPARPIIAGPKVREEMMTRRFTVLEKIMIIDK